MIVGTAGHIDHGKSALVRRLTGVETDRLKEEKARGISIDLGFAYWSRPNGNVIGFVDVPGHEALVHNMLAGATGIDFVMLVVAADDGIMPQTREHIAIMDLLGIRRGLVALNKCDLVDADRVVEVTRDVTNALSGTTLRNSPVFPVSAVTGEGLDALSAALDAADAEHRQTSTSTGRFRLAVDRCFTLQGLGTAVTGTVISGAVGVDDHVLVSPSGLQARVRSIRAHDRPANPGVQGQRCALVLAGPAIGKDTVHRGDVVLDPALHAPTQRIDARVTILRSEPRPIGQWFPVKVHHAAAEIPGRVVVLKDGALSPGETDFIQLVLERPLAAASGDRFILRDTSSSRTVGGGTFVDLRAIDRRRRTPERRRFLEALSNSDPADALVEVLRGPPGWLDFSAFVRDRALDDATAQVLAARDDLALIPQKDVLIALPRAGDKALSALLSATLEDFHAKQPDMPGIGLEQLRRSCAPAMPAPLFLAIIRANVQAGNLALDRTWVRKPDHQVRFSLEDENLWSEIAPLLAADPYRPPRVRDLAHTLDVDEAAVRRLMRMVARRGDADEIAIDHYFLRRTIQDMAMIAIDVAAHAPDGKFSAADFRDRLDNGRKVAIQILEFFDKHGFTMRRQDLRRINPQRIEAFAPSATLIKQGGVPLPVGRPDFKSGWGRQTVPGGFDSHPPPPKSREV